GLNDLAMVFLAVHDRGEDVVDAPAVLDREFDGIRRPARQVEQGQVRLTRRTHARVCGDRRIADGADFRFLRWRKPTPRILSTWFSSLNSVQRLSVLSPENDKSSD